MGKGNAIANRSNLGGAGVRERASVGTNPQQREVFRTLGSQARPEAATEAGMRVRQTAQPML